MSLLLFAAALAQDAGPTGGIVGGLYSTAEDNPLDQALGFGLRLGVKIVPVFDIEVEVGRYEGETRDLGIVYFLYDPRLDAVFHFTPDRRADLFLAVGGGMQYVDVRRESEADQPDAKNDRALYVNPSSDFVMNAGPGMTLHLVGPLHLRTDVRWLGSFGPDGTADLSDTFQNLEWTLGIDLRAEEPPDLDGDGYKNRFDDCPEDAEDFDDFEDDDGCPDWDNDDDGITDGRDGCDDDPEDMDGFEDKDGCPDDDNDGDGIRDGKDKCPDAAEDEDGYKDADGCPDKDNDQDGISDRRDQCPDDPETFNGIDDTDGCPEDDRDGDGFLDAVDDCPDEPETFNRFEDGDGCPDEIPAAVKKFTGAIRGISFETNKAVIRRSSEPTLTEALQVLRDYPDIRLEVQGHTDNVGNDAFNLDLSQRRADAVIAWFITHGTDPSRLRAVGFGETVPVAENENETGRAENRRVEFRLIEGG